VPRRSLDLSDEELAAVKTIEGQSAPEVKANLTTRPAHGGIVLRPVARAHWLGGISESTEIRLSQTDPDFPRKVVVSVGLMGYLADELDAYVEKKKQRRDAGEVPSIVLSGRRLGKSGKGGRPRGRGAQLEMQLLPSAAADSDRE
jgi:predicted DNA-binding transcriptional regulator AlpA